jgi:dipeptidase E
VVRLYLSSFRMGDHPEHLAALVGEGGRRAVVIANAMDDAPADVRRGGVQRELAALTDLGFDPVELDLRDYFGQERRLRRDLAGVALAWLRGGNVFMLRFALFRSAGDVVFGDLLAADALVYAGYSAGGCVLSSTLRGLELVDDAGAVMRIYGSQPVWDGLALLNEAFLPHYQSPGHPETAAIDIVAARYQAAGVGYRPLRDGQALLINGADTEVV